MRQRPFATVVAFVVITVVLFGATLIAGNKPLLGLDLQGGVSVVLAPAQPAESETIDQAIEIIRNRVDALGVAEPEITRQGDNILVQLPGIEDQERALQLVGTTAELRFRPVLRTIAAEGTTLEDLGIDPNATTTTAPTTTGPDGATTTTAVPQTSEERRASLEEALGLNVPTTSSADDLAENTVVLPEFDRKTGDQTKRFELGPAPVTGSAVQSADWSLSPTGAPYVQVSLKGGDQGTDQINQLAMSCRSMDATCPGGLMAIVLDGRVQVAAQIASDSMPPFPDGQLSITGDYSKAEAKDISLALKYGSLPVALETQSVQKVSATLGSDAKDAGIIAGIVGLALVSIYVIAYYRLLGMVALVSLGLSYMLLWAVVAYLGETRGLAFTLAGMMGIIVSIGVSLDSNIVYFEHMKEDVRNGRSPRSSADRSFAAAFSTILKADMASLIGAVVLYYLTVGAVRGFAFFLGLSMVLDLLATYFFLGSSVRLIARHPHFSKRPLWYGLPRPRSESDDHWVAEASPKSEVTV